MKISLVHQNKRFECTLSYNGADYVIARGLDICPLCKADLKVAGRKGTMRNDHDTYYAEAGCLSCGGTLGELQTQVSTVFGIDEDEAVLNGRARVY